MAEEPASAALVHTRGISKTGATLRARQLGFGVALLCERKKKGGSSWDVCQRHVSGGTEGCTARNIGVGRAVARVGWYAIVQTGSVHC